MAYIVKGDKYYIPITVKSNSGSIIYPNMVTKIQFLVGGLDKEFNNTSSSVITFDETEEVYMFPVTEEETFDQSGGMKVQVRVVTTDNEIYGSISKVVDVYGVYTSKLLL